MKRQDGKPRLFSFTLRDFLIFAAIFICALVLCTLLRRSDIMISDFSGVIFDFALVYDKPVIYADTEFDKSPYDAWWLDTPYWTFDVLPRIGWIDAGIKFNVVPAKVKALVLGLAAKDVKPYLANAEKKTRATFDVVDEAEGAVIYAQGVNAHASTPYEGVNALTALNTLVSLSRKMIFAIKAGILMETACGSTT